MRTPTDITMSPHAMDRRFAATPRDIDYVIDRRGPLEALLRELPQKQRDAIRLFFIEDSPAEDVARAVGVSAQQLSAILSDAGDALRDAARRRFPALCANGNGACR